MAKKINTTFLGLFVIGASALVITAIGLFGSGMMFKQADQYVIFFPESVQGLTVGAPVQFRGVQIGSVINIEALYQPKEKKIIIPVFIEIVRDRIKNLSMEDASPQQRQENMEKAGLRAQLISQSIVTGQRAVGIIFDPSSKPRFVGAEPDITEIASIPSSIEQLSNQIEKLPLDEIAQKLSTTLSAIEAAVTSHQFTEGMNAIGPSMIEARQMLAAVNRDLPPLLKEIRAKVEVIDTAKMSGQLDRTLTNLDGAAKNIQSFTREGAPFDRNANRALIEIAGAARELRQLAELLQRRPEALLSGKK